MKKIGLVLFTIVLLLLLMSLRGQNTKEQKQVMTERQNVPNQKFVADEDSERISVFSTGLKVPWAIAFLPVRASDIAGAGEEEGGLLVTERGGTVRFVSKTGVVRQDPVAIIPRVKQIGEGGLHGIAVHPNFAKNGYVYLYYTYSGSVNTLNRVVRFTYDGGKLKNEEIIVDAIPGAPNHDGGRINFGPDGYLYITTGDAEVPTRAQDTRFLSGKILRVTGAGDSVQGNPFGNLVYSYGHRNPQGIAWDDQGQLWETEHGPSGLETGNDEFNKIEIGQNYGWPQIRGTKTQPGMVIPVRESGRQDTWAPAGLAFINNSFYFAGLRGSALYQVTVSGNNTELKTHFKNEYGRLREVVTGPDGMLYVTTSNRDGRGKPKQEDDMILRINPEKL